MIIALIISPRLRIKSRGIIVFWEKGLIKTSYEYVASFIGGMASRPH